MSTESFFYCAPCRLKILIVPLGKVRASYFTQCLQLFREKVTLPLRDVVDDRLSRAMFNPVAFPQGQLLFEYLTDWDSRYAYLDDFQHWRKLYAIVAVKDEKATNGNDGTLKEFDELRNKYKVALVQRQFVPLPFPINQDASRSAINSFLVGLSSQLLLTLSDTAQAIQALPTVRSPTDPVFETPQDLKRPASVGPETLQRGPSPTNIKSAARSSLATSQIASADNVIEKRGSSKGRGRVLKVLGDLYLLCGFLPSAIASYTQSVEILRLTTDHFWHASALEGVGMALVLLAFLKVDFPIPSIVQGSPSGALGYGEEGKPPIRVLEDGQSTNDISTDPFPSQSLLDVLPELHAQILNLYKRSLLSSSGEQASAVCLSDGILRLAKLLCDVYVLGGLDERVLVVNVLGYPVDKSTSKARGSYPPKGEIARWAMRAWGSHLDHESIPVTHKIKVAAALIQIMGIIGFHRKRGALLNELLRLSIPHLVQARVIGAAEWGLHPNAALGLVQQVADDSLMSLLESIADVYGARLPVNDKASYGWPSLRIEILRKCISLCEALPHPDGIAHFTSLLFALSGDTLPKEEEIRLAGNLPRAIVTGKKRGLNVEAYYWDMFVIQGINVIGSSSVETLHQTPSEGHQPDGNQALFLVTQQGKEAGRDEQVVWLVQDEEVQVSLRLRNHHHFDLEITSLTLLTGGVKIEMVPSSFILPAQTFHVHTAMFIPRESGELDIQGCVIKFSTCKTQEFWLFGNRSRRERDIWYDMRGGEIKVKEIGISGQTKMSDDVGADQFWIRRSVSAKVLPPQPVLVLERCPLGDAAVMLLEGETKRFDFDLRNRSTSSVNFLSVSFSDSTVPVLEDALASGNVTEDERIELDHFLYDRPALLWLPSSPSPCLISANEATNIKIQTNGKRGLTKGTVNISYGFATAPNFDLHQRRIEYSLAVTVNASLELIACDFLPRHFSNCRPVHDVQNPQGLARDSFLLVLEVRNSWIHPLDLNLDMHPDGAESRTITYRFLTGQARRVILTLPRHVLASKQIETPLPGRRKDQQFVLPKPSFQTIARREAWWYRQYLLESLSGKWRESAGDLRRGDLEMRGIRLSERHVRVVRRQALETFLEITPVRSTDAKDPCRHIKVRVQSHLDRVVTCCLRLTVVPVEDADVDLKSVCVDGLMHSPMIVVPGGEEASWATEITILGQGEYEIVAVIHELSRTNRNNCQRWISRPCRMLCGGGKNTLETLLAKNYDL